MGAGRFFITDDCESLETALSDAVWNKDVKDKDERLDDGSTDIDESGRIRVHDRTGHEILDTGGGRCLMELRGCGGG